MPKASTILGLAVLGAAAYGINKRMQSAELEEQKEAEASAPTKPLENPPQEARAEPKKAPSRPKRKLKKAQEEDDTSLEEEAEELMALPESSRMTLKGHMRELIEKIKEGRFRPDEDELDEAI